MANTICDVCGQDMRDSKTTEEAKAAIVVNPGPNSFNGRQLLAAFGKANFQICIVCMVKSLGVRPVKAAEPEPETVTADSGETTFVPETRKPGRPRKEMILNEG